MAHYSLIATVMLLVLTLICYITVMALAHSTRRVAVPALAGGGELPSDIEVPVEGAVESPQGLTRYGTLFAQLALALLTASLILRSIAVGHGPFANQFEFSVAFGWGMIAAYVYAEHRYHARTLALLILPIATALLLYATTIVGDGAIPLVPALQNNLLLTVHVALAIIAYGGFSVGCAAGFLYLIQPEGGRRGLPRPELLDEISYRAVIISFPLLTMVIILGAVWANVAWGTYWSWDPKETASLVTWLIYGAYLHARVVRGWRGRKAAWLLMLGFAAVLFTFFGNLFFGGLHSYGGKTA